MKTRQVFSRGRLVGNVCSLLFIFSVANLHGQNVLTAHYNNARTGADTNETILNTSNVASSFGQLFVNSVDGQVYAQPLYVQNLNISGGTHNVVFVCTENNSVYAFDADTAGTTYWHVNLGSPFTTSCGDLTPVIGITGTPVIDLSGGTLYVDANNASGPSHKLHALDITTGNEKFNGPVTISTSGFDSSLEHQRPGLLLLNGTVYVAFGSHCDNGSYHGYFLGYNATNVLQQQHAFNVTPSGTQGAIWQAGGGPAVDASGNIYIMVGNGSFDGTANFGESYVKFNQSLSVLDFATPSNWASLNSGDVDFGSGSPVCLPSGYVVGEGKDGNMYVANESNMGHVGHFAQQFSAASLGDTVGPAVYWNGPSKQYVFVIHGNTPTRSFQWNGTSFNTTPLGSSSFTPNNRVGGISLSANGQNNGILWEVGSDNNLRAYDAVNFPTILKTLSVGTYVKMNRPTIANGKVYVGTANSLAVYGLSGTNTIKDCAATLTVCCTNTHWHIGNDTHMCGGKGLFMDSTGTNQYFTVEVPGVQAITYDVTIGVKLNTNRGISQLSIAPGSGGPYNNEGAPWDNYHGSISYVPVNIGNVTFGTSGTQFFRFTIVGKNTASVGYTLGVDYIQLTP